VNGVILEGAGSIWADSGRWAVSTAQATSAVTEPQDGSGSLGQPFGRGPLAA